MRPDYLNSGDVARLIPAVNESNREHRLLSPVLAAMRIVPELAAALLRPFGQRVSVRTSIRTYTEVVFKGADLDGDRPDGLIVLDTSRSVWRALVEAKYGNNDLNPQQVERYLELARKCDLDAVVTISNQFAANPAHSPVVVSGTLTRKVALYHLSWSAIRTEVELLRAADEFDDTERKLVLGELHRYLNHQSSGISGFAQMNSGWKDVVKTLAARGKLGRDHKDIVATATDWMQEQKDLCLILTRKLHTPVELRISRRYADSPQEWAEDIARELVDERFLRAEFRVPDAAADIVMEVLIAAKLVTTAMKLRAPEDRKSTHARVNWIVRQLEQTEDPRIVLRVHFPSRRGPRDLILKDVLADRDILKSLDDGPPCSAIEVMLVEDMGGRFNGNRTFIEHLEAAFADFYDEVAQYLKGWRPAPPKPVERDQDIESTEPSGEEDAEPAPKRDLGNDTKNLLWEVLRDR